MPITDKALDQDTRSRVVEAAGRVFAEKGYELATVREICHAAKANVAAVNYYFRDKRQLYLEAMRAAHEGALRHSPPPQSTGGETDEELLYAFVHALLRRLLGEQNSWHTKLVLRELAAPSTETVEMICQYIRPQFAMAVELAGRLAPGLSSDRRHCMVFSIVGQCVYYCVARPIVPLLIGADEHRHLTTERLARHITEFSLHALRGLSETAKGVRA